MARTWMDMHRLRRLHDSQYIMKNPFTNENSNLSNIFHNNILRKKVESLKVRSTEEFLCQFAWLPCRFFRGRRQGRQPLNPAMPRRVVVAAKHSFSYPGARPCRRPSLKSFSLLGFSRFWGFGVGKKRVKFEDAFWRSLLGGFLVDFWSIFIFFWYCPRVKIV